MHYRCWRLSTAGVWGSFLHKRLRGGAVDPEAWVAEICAGAVARVSWHWCQNDPTLSEVAPRRREFAAGSAMTEGPMTEGPVG